MTKEILGMMAALSSAEDADVSACLREIDSHISACDFDWARSLGAALADQISKGEDTHGRCETALDRILHVLATHAGMESLRALLRLPVSPHLDDSVRTVAERRLASIVARYHTIEDIVQTVFSQDSQSVHSTEFSACLLHELVLVADGVEEHPELRSFAEELVTGEHPLARLPLRLLPEEHWLRRPQDAADGWSWMVPPTPAITFGTPEVLYANSMRQRTAGVELTEVSSAESVSVMGAAVQHWCDDSNGKMTAHEYWSPDALTEKDLPAAFNLLPLAPWPADQVRAKLYPSTPDSVLQVLLTAAVRAPAYGPGLYGAYGRLAAWCSIGGLAGAPPDSPIVHTAELVRKVVWFRLSTTSAWFYQVAWDLAITALRPNGQEIAVIAATDTD